MRHLLILFCCLVSVVIFSQTTQTFTTSGTFTVPAGVTNILVEAWGAGGAGGSAVGTGPTTNYRAQAGGGGGGAYVSGNISVTPGSMISYTVAANTGVNAGTTPVNGGASSFGSISAPGGFGGECVDAAAAGGNIGGVGGAGGAGTYNGGAGGTRTGYSGNNTSGTSAGGGGGAGDISNGGDANTTTNTGGTGGAAGGGNGANGPNTSGNNGSVGTIIGGGGSGAWAAASTTFRNGGAGARGQIKISYSVLPISVVSFTAENDHSKSMLTWITASETNNAFFNIERSTDDKIFESISQISGAGNSNQIISYVFLDHNPHKGINYYRIKQTDFDGNYQYSNVRSVSFGNTRTIKIKPSVTEDYTELITELDFYNADIFNAEGHHVKHIANLSKQQIISMGDLKTGLYFIQINDNISVTTIRVLKL